MRLENKQPKDLLTIEDLDYITTQLCSDASEEDEISAQWAQGIEDSDDSDLVFIARDDLCGIEQTLSNSAFALAMSLNRTDVIWTMHPQLGTGQCDQFHGVRIDTCANRRLIISEGKYCA